jgi:hypothetical protein
MRVAEQGPLPADNLPAPTPGNSPTGTCSSPADPGCAKCCRIDPDGGMSLLSWTGAADDTSGVKPWYNKQEVTPDCPAGTRDCAPCLEREQAEYNALVAPDGCDCKAETPGVDPCHAPKSCGCYCSRKQRLEPMCGNPE